MIFMAKKIIPGKGKNEGVQVSVDSGSNQPYVKYEITADICDRGVGFTIKHSIGSFMQSHGYVHRMTEFQATSDSMTAVIELLDNGKYDFNMDALIKHLYASGRLPSKQEKQPKISLRPIPCLEHVSVIQQTRDDVAWKKVVEGLNEQLGSKEGVIQNLTDSLAQRQKELQEATRKNTDLERRVQGLAQRPIRFETPELAVVRSYLTGSLESLFYASADWEDLGESRNAFVEFSGKTFFEYVKEKYGLDVKDASELNSWYGEMGKATGWDETKEAREYQEKKRTFAANKLVLEMAEKGQAGEGMISMIKKQIAEDEAKEHELESQIAASKGVFERDHGIYQAVKSDEQNYNQFGDIRAKSEARRADETELPILISMGSGDTPYLRAFVPTADKGSELEKHVHTRVASVLNLSEDYSVVMNEYDHKVNEHENEIMEFSVEPRTGIDAKKMKKDFGRFFRYLKRNEDKLREDPILNSLGMKLRVVTVYD